MRLFKNDAEKVFDVDVISSAKMEAAQQLWKNIIQGTPYWIDENIRSINFGRFLASYTAKKACLELDVKIEGSARAEWIDSVITAMIGKCFRDKVEDACGMGGIILKPNGNANVNNAIDYVMPDDYVITAQNSNGDILGIIFKDGMSRGDYYYTKLEYHHFKDVVIDGVVKSVCVVENKAFKSRSINSLGDNISLDEVSEWRGLEPYVEIENINRLLMGYLKMPNNNVIDYASPEGVAIFDSAITELRDLDIAWSKKGNEVEDSVHITFIDEAALTKRDASGNRVHIKLPRFVKGLRRGTDAASTIDEHVPTMLTSDRIADINSILSMAGTKCGFSQGQFILDRKTGAITATQIESDDSETVETITDIRTAIKKAIIDVVYALDKYADLYDITPVGYVNALDDKVASEDVFYFKDLLSTFEQDRTRAYTLVIQGMYSKRKYLKEYEGLTDEEIDNMFSEIQNEQGEKKQLFDEE